MFSKLRDVCSREKSSPETCTFFAQIMYLNAFYDFRWSQINAPKTIVKKNGDQIHKDPSPVSLTDLDRK